MKATCTDLQQRNARPCDGLGVTHRMRRTGRLLDALAVQLQHERGSGNELRPSQRQPLREGEARVARGVHLDSGQGELRLRFRLGWVGIGWG